MNTIKQDILPKDIMDKVRHIEIRTKRLVNDGLAGSYHSVFKGQGMDFEEVREYVAGDDIRAIDWNVTARTGKAHIKKFTEERERTLMLLIDISGSGDFGSTYRSKREMMAELGAALAFSAIRNNDCVGVILFTDSIELYIPPNKGRRHILRIVREILFFQPKGRKTDIVMALHFFRTVMQRRAVVFVLSDFCVSGDFSCQLDQIRPGLQVIERRHDVMVFVINDPRESTLPNVGWITLEDAETGEQLEVNTASETVRKRFSAQAEERKKKLHGVIRGCGIDILHLPTDNDYLPALIQFFTSRERRRV